MAELNFDFTVNSEAAMRKIKELEKGIASVGKVMEEESRKVDAFDTDVLIMCSHLDKYFDKLLNKSEELNSMLQFGKIEFDAPSMKSDSISKEQLDELSTKNAELTEEIKKQKEEIIQQKKAWSDLAESIKSNSISSINEFNQTIISTSDAVKSAKVELKGLTKDLDKNIQYYEELTIQAATYKEELVKLQAAQKNGVTRVLADNAGTSMPISDEIERLSTNFQRVRENQKGISSEITTQRQRQAELNTIIESENEKHLHTGNLLMNAREQLIQMRDAGLQNTAQYQLASEELGRMGKQVQLINSEMEYLSNPDKNIATLKAGLEGVAGSVGLVVSIMGLFNQKIEEMEQIQTKVQSLLEVVVGLENTYNTVKKAGILMRATESLQRKANIAAMALETKAKTGNVALTWAEVAAQKAFNIVASANPYVLLAVALLSVVGGIALLVSANKKSTIEQEKANRAMKEAKEIQESYTKEVASNAASQMVAYQKLKREYNSLGDDLDSKKKLIADNQDAFKNLGIAVGGVSDAEKVFNGQTDAVINAIMLRAKAAAAASVAQDSYKKMFERMGQLELAKREFKPLEQMAREAAKSQGRNYDTEEDGIKQQWQDSVRKQFEEQKNMIATLKKGKDDLENAGDSWMRTSNIYTNKAGNVLKSAGLKVYDDPSKQESYASKEAEKRKKVEEKIAEELLSLRRKNQQDEINLMEEGSKKKLAQIEMDYKKEISAIKKQEEEWSKAQGGSLTDKQLQDVSEAYNNADSKREKGITDTSKEEGERLKALLEKYRDFDAQRTAIEKEGNNDIAELQARRTNENAVEIDRAIKVAQKKIKDGVQQINDAQATEETKDNPFLKDLFGDTSKMAFNDLQKLIEQAKLLREHLSSNGNAKDVTFISPEELAIIKKSPAEFDKLEDGLDNLLKVGKTNEWDGIFDGFTKGIAKLKSAKGFKEVSEGMQDIGESASAAANIIGGVAGNLASMFEEMGNAGAADAMGSVQDAMNAISNIGQGFAKGGIVGGIAAAVGEAANFIGKAFAANARHKEALKEIMNETTAQQREYNLLLMQQNLEYEKATTIFGTDTYGKAANAVTVMKDAVADLNEELKGSGKYEGGYAFSFKNGLVDTLSQAQRSTMDAYAGLANIEIKTGHKKTGLFGWGKGKDIYSSILSVYPDLIEANGKFNASLAETIINTKTMSEEDKAAFQNMIDLAKQQEVALQVVKDYMADIFGELGNTMSDTLVDAFVNGTDAAQAFADSVSDMLETLAKQMVYSVTLGPLMEKAQKAMLDVMQDTSLSEEQKFEQWTSILGNLADNAISEQERTNRLLEEYKKSAADKGFDIFNSDSSSMDSFISGIESAFTSLEATAKDVSDNIYDYFRQAMIKALYEKEYKSKMEEVFKEFRKLSADGLSEGDVAQLNSQIDQYIDQMMKGVEGVNSLFSDKLQNAEDLRSFVDNVKSAMSSIEATAEDVTDSVFEYIRQQMVDKMFADTFQPQIEAFYKKVQAAMSDGSVSAEERNTLRDEADKLAKDIIAAKDILSNTLGISADNIMKAADEEFRSFSDSILSSLSDAEVTAKVISKNIAESMRKELIEAMYLEQYEPRIRAIWDKWKEYSEDGLVTDEERASIKNDIDEISKEVADATKEISDAWTDTGEDMEKAFESFSDSIKNVLYNAEATAEDVANNIYQYMRNALVDSMFSAQLQPQIKEWYDKYTEFMKDGVIDTAERKTLDEMISEIQKAGIEIVDAANKLFPTLDTGAQKRAEEAVQEAENAKNEAEQEWESFSDDMLSSLYDIESTAEDISDSMGEYMRKALIKAMYVNNFKPQMQKWYNEWQRAMGDDNLTSEEKQMLESMKQTMIDDMKKEVDTINQMFGSTYSQEASSKGFDGMSQETGEELNGRFTAMQVSNEEIKTQMISAIVGINSLVSISTGSNATLSNILSQHVITNSYLGDISKYTKKINDLEKVSNDCLKELKRL